MHLFIVRPIERNDAGIVGHLHIDAAVVTHAERPQFALNGHRISRSGEVRGVSAALRRSRGQAGDWREVQFPHASLLSRVTQKHLLPHTTAND